MPTQFGGFVYAQIALEDEVLPFLDPPGILAPMMD
jgi:hypothetical protein